MLKDGDSITQASSSAELGKSVKAGLPNITGTLDANVRTLDYAHIASGAFSRSVSPIVWQGVSDSGGSNQSRFTFRASDSDSTYGNSTTVTDEQVRLRHFVVLASAQNSASVFDWSNYMVVQRKIAGQTRYFLERLAPVWTDSQPIADAYFVDCGLSIRAAAPTREVAGLEHLEGCSLAVLADGSPVEGCVVRGGRIELPYAATAVQAGLPYVSVLSPLPVESDLNSGTTLAHGRAYGSCRLPAPKYISSALARTRWRKLMDINKFTDKAREAVGQVAHSQKKVARRAARHRVPLPCEAQFCPLADA